MKKIRKRRKNVVPSHCQFCGKRIGSSESASVVAGKGGPSIDTSGREGTLVEMTPPSLGKKIRAVVPMPDSEAAGEGHNLVFVFCSEKCARDFKAEMYDQTDLVTDLTLLRSKPAEMGYSFKK